MESQGVWERFKKFKSSNYAKVYPRASPRVTRFSGPGHDKIV